MSKIIYTYTDEAPALATHSLLPIFQSFAKTADIEIELKNISLSARILAHFNDYLTTNQKQSDDLLWLGDLVKNPEANIIKLPNISASIPQLVSAINELQLQGYDIPSYPFNPKNDLEAQIQKRYAKVLGSAVNPVLREGNSDRRVADPVKQFAKKNPHSMGQWQANSKTTVAHMSDNDFYANEQSYTMPEDGFVNIELETNSKKTLLKENIKLEKDEIIDATYMSIEALTEFYQQSIVKAKKQGVLLSLHLKATMMKVSDPILFGHAVKIFLKDAFDKHRVLFEELDVNPNNGIQSLLDKIDTLDTDIKKIVLEDINKAYANNPGLAMVNSDKGITNLHVPSDVIIDASMPAAIRASGKMWGSDNQMHDTLAMIPDRCYSTMYKEIINFCKENGAFDPSTMGTVPNVGLMAKKAEEYGSHDKTFEITEDGKVIVRDHNDNIVMLHEVKKGDIWRMCQTKDAPVRDWVKLAVTRAQLTNMPAVFWLDEKRAHDKNLIKKVNQYLSDLNTENLVIHIMNPVDAMRYTCDRLIKGEDTISVTGNVLRDYLTDLFPILELGTSAKMLSIVPLLTGGGLFETGAGGSAPKHVEQLQQENYLRWDSLGEFLATAVSLEDIARKTNNFDASILAKTLNQANEKILSENKSPSRKIGDIDNRGSHFYLALYWAEALSMQTESTTLSTIFSPIYRLLKNKTAEIIHELNAVQGNLVNLDGYYHPNKSSLDKIMRPSHTFNNILLNI